MSGTIAERREANAQERELLAEMGVQIADGPRCRECGCSQSLACPGGCWWVEGDLCNQCAADFEDEAA